MPSKYPVLTSEEVVCRLANHGFVFVSQKGSHRKYRKEDRVVIVPMHTEIARGTLRSILLQANMAIEDF